MREDEDPIEEWLGGEGGSGAEDDLPGGSPTPGDSDEDERDRPDGYSESGASDDDRDDEADEEDEGDDDNDEDEDPRRGLSPDRSWESVAREKDRRLKKQNREIQAVLSQLAATQDTMAKLLGAARPAEPQVPDKAPHTLAEIQGMLAEGRTEEAIRAQEALDDWKTAKIKADVSGQLRRETQVSKLRSLVRNNLDLQGNEPYARAVGSKIRELREELPDASDDEVSLLARALVNADDVRKAGRKRDLRGDSQRREDARRRETRGGPDRRPSMERPEASTKLTPELRRGLERAGLWEKYQEMAKSKDGKERVRKSLARVKARAAEVRSQALRG